MDANFISVYDKNNQKFVYFVQRILGVEIKFSNTDKYNVKTR